MTKYRNDVTAYRLREVLSYDPETGVFRWKVSLGKRVKVGDIAGGDNGKGYLRIKIDGIEYRAHRLAWLYVHGVWPSDQLDHRSTVRQDNRIDNLREATNAQNQQNQTRRTNNKSGHQGVCWRKGRKKWQAEIQVNGVKIHIGLFDDIADAIEARAKAKRELHEFQPFDRSAC